MAQKRRLFIEPGRRFGRLIVIMEIPGRRRPILVKCDCGNEAITCLYDLLRGSKKSCNCLHDDAAKTNRRTHGLSKHPAYKCWNCMMNRCLNPKDPSYASYGGRGVTVCGKWRTFPGFLDDMGGLYSEGMTLERVDVNGGYQLDNCAWIPKGEQSRNTRKNARNTSGKTGVMRIQKGRHVYYIASWNDENKAPKRKPFSVLKLGDVEAFKQACEYRDARIKELEAIGIKYGINHGK